MCRYETAHSSTHSLTYSLAVDMDPGRAVLPSISQIPARAAARMLRRRWTMAACAHRAVSTLIQATQQSTQLAFLSRRPYTDRPTDRQPGTTNGLTSRQRFHSIVSSDPPVMDSHHGQRSNRNVQAIGR